MHDRSGRLAVRRGKWAFCCRRAAAAVRSGVVTIPASGARSARMRGVLAYVLSTVLLTVQDAITKLLTDSFAPIEVLFYRGFAALLPVGLIVWMSGGRARFRTPRPWVNLLRGALSLCTSVLVIWSFVFLPLAEALAVIFLSPLLVTALSGPTLGETVGWRHWAAVGTGFLGALLIVRPAGDAALDWTILVPLGAALGGAVRDLITRRLGATDHPSTVLMYSMVVMFLGSAVIVLPSDPHIPTAYDWSLIVASAVLVTGAYLCQIVGLKLAAAATIAPWRYLSLVWGGMLGWAIWGDVMPPAKVLGCALVVVSGLYVLRAAEKPG
jgi:drug/metabolite transporter (DMT)-like permease